MKFDGFDIQSIPIIQATRNCKCGGVFHVVSQGWFAECFFCEKCESVYILKMVKYPKNRLNPKFIESCKKEIEAKKKK